MVSRRGANFALHCGLVGANNQGSWISTLSIRDVWVFKRRWSVPMLAGGAARTRYARRTDFLGPPPLLAGPDAVPAAADVRTAPNRRAARLMGRKMPIEQPFCGRSCGGELGFASCRPGSRLGGCSAHRARG